MFLKEITLKLRNNFKSNSVNERGCLKGPLNLIGQVEGVETIIDYQ